jgi:hypothetical protein
MKRIHGENHIIVDGKKQFAEGTSVTADWFNDVQEELCNLIESEIELGEAQTQLKEVIELKIRLSLTKIEKNIEKRLNDLEKSFDEKLNKLNDSVSPMFETKSPKYPHSSEHSESFINIIKSMSGNDYLVMRKLYENWSNTL